MEKTESAHGKDSPRLCILRFKLQPLDGDSSSGGGRGAENEVRTQLSSSSLIDENTQECLLCQKKFPSMKSLCGHMKMHPEREWRGIQPPDEEVKVERIVHGWSVTGKRGRRADYYVASALNSTSVKIGGCSARGSMEEGKQGDEAGNRTAAEVETETPPETKILPDDPRGSEETRDKTSCVGRKNSKGKRVTKREARVLDGIGKGCRDKKTRGDTGGHAADADANYTCNRCQKSFRSHQALGGHMSSCGKPKQSDMPSQAANANMPVVLSREPDLDLSLSLSLTPYNPGSSTSVAISDNKNDPPSTEESEDDQPKMIKFL